MSEASAIRLDGTRLGIMIDAFQVGKIERYEAAQQGHAGLLERVACDLDAILGK